MPSRLRFVMAQMGRKPGAGQSLSRLVDVEDLPGSGWRVIDKRTWRTGVQTPDEPWAQRAAAAESVTAWRSFRQSDRWLWGQLVPLASAVDAATALAEVPGRRLANLRAKARIESESEVPGITVEGCNATWAYEQYMIGARHSGVTRMLAGTLGSDLLVLAGSGQPDWTWDDLTAVAARQVERLKS